MLRIIFHLEIMCKTECDITRIYTHYNVITRITWSDEEKSDFVHRKRSMAMRKGEKNVRKTSVTACTIDRNTHKFKLVVSIYDVQAIVQ